MLSTTYYSSTIDTLLVVEKNQEPDTHVHTFHCLSLSRLTSPPTHPSRDVSTHTGHRTLYNQELLLDPLNAEKCMHG